MKKVAIFTNSLKGGGAERIISYLLNEGDQEFEFHLILQENKIDYIIPEKIKIFQLEKKVTPGYLNVLKFPLLSRKLHTYLKENNIDTLLSLLNRPNLISCRVKKSGWKGKLIISERADTIAYYKTRRFGALMLRMVRKYYPLADQITVISEGIAHSLKRLGISNCKVIYNPVHILPEIDTALRKKNEKFTYINVGRFYEQKNHRLLLEAFAKLKNKDNRLLLVGKGKLEPEMKKLAKDLEIEDRVEFLGQRNDVNQWLQASDCFVFSSDFEGFGNVITEALNNGVPVISTDCPHGPREILDPQTKGNVVTDKIELAKYGILVPVKNSGLLAEAMDRMYEDAELRTSYARLSHERVKDFDIKKIAREYFDIF